MDLKKIKESIKSGEYKIQKKDRNDDGVKRKFSGIWTSTYQIWELDQNGVESKILEGYVCCSVCQHVMRYKKEFGTSSILKHSEKHNKVQDASINSTTKPKGIESISAQHKETLLNVSTNFVTYDLRPNKAVEGDGFLDLVETIWNMGAELGPISRKNYWTYFLVATL